MEDTSMLNANMNMNLNMNQNANVNGNMNMYANAAADVSNKANIYKTQQVMTASPQELTLMLYNGAIRFVIESMRGIENKNLEKAHESNLRAQNIVRELMNSLDSNYEVSGGLTQIYDYIEYRLVQGNMKKDVEQLEEAKEMLTELRDTWFQAMKLAREQQGVSKIG